MSLRDSLDRALTAALEEHPATHRVFVEGHDEGRGEAADALQDLQAARNALLDAAARLDRAT